MEAKTKECEPRPVRLGLIICRVAKEIHNLQFLVISRRIKMSDAKLA